jgi:hypothetical protein
LGVRCWNIGRARCQNGKEVVVDYKKPLTNDENTADRG